MSTMYTVQQGDCLSSIARANGFADWQTIYNDPNNADFRRLRPDPNVIFPGDQLFIPDVTEGAETRATDSRHSFQLALPPVSLRLVLLDGDHQPLANVNYTLEVNDVATEGHTDSAGLVEKAIPPNTTAGRISVRLSGNAGDQSGDTGYTWDLQIGALDPESAMTGIQARLNNLGYNTGPVDGVQGPRTTEAIREFQTKYNLEVDGVGGPITRSKLVEVHGC